MALLRELVLVVAALTAARGQSRVHPPSPCPRVFSYKGDEAGVDRWDGVVRLSTDEPLVGIRLDVQLDRPAKILGNWDGEVSTRDSVRYTILNLETRLRPGPPRSLEVFVRYDERDPVPRVRSIALNGRRICPEDDGGGGGGNDRDTVGVAARPTKRPTYQTGSGSGGGVVYEGETQPSRPSSGVDPLSNDGGSSGRRTTPRRPAGDPYGDRRTTTEPDLLPERPTRRPTVQSNRDRTTSRPPAAVVPAGGVGSGDRRPEHRPTRDPFGGGGIREDTTTRRNTFDQDPFEDRRTTSATQMTRRTSVLPFHNVWGDETTTTTTVRQRPPDAEWINPGADIPTTEATTRRTTRAPAHDDGSVRCGTVDPQATPLVTNGQRTSRGQWPWHAALYQSKGIDLTYKCGGSLISRNTVVTAAHCVTARLTDRAVEADTLVVFIGKYHLKLWSEGGVQDKQVSSVYVHAAYNSSSFYADIALLILTSPVDFTTFVRPVCLWGSANTDIQSLENADGYVVGWGYDETGRVTEELMLAKMPVVSQQACLWSHPQFFSHFTSNRTYCAGFRNGTSVCNGDSGGGMVFPMTTRDGARIWQLRGIVSISVSKEDQRVCDTTHFVVFTDVAKYLDWIRKYIK